MADVVTRVTFLREESNAIINRAIEELIILGNGYNQTTSRSRMTEMLMRKVLYNAADRFENVLCEKE